MVDSSALTIHADPQRDYWRKTYYEPLLVKDDGPCYLVHLDANQIFTAEVTMSLKPLKQFDQVNLQICSATNDSGRSLFKN